MKKVIPLVILICIMFYTGCEDHMHFPKARRYPADVAVAWINLEQKLVKTTTGFSPGIAARAFAYTGLSLYEAIVPGMPGYRSATTYMGAPSITPPTDCNRFYWPASANAAMAKMIRNLFPTTSAANKVSIDSLESEFNSLFQQYGHDDVLEASADFGKVVAESLFEWSKTDGAHEGYLPQPNTYVPPVGPGLWIPTPPAFAPAATPAGGNNRTFVPGLADQTQPAKFPLPAYSEDPSSDFFAMVNELYTISQSLTPNDIRTVRTWADIPGNYNGTAHFTNIATQLIIKKGLQLDEAALLYAKHGIAIRDAVISCFKTKYKYNVIRPISYIRNVMGHSTWNAVIPTPPHPEYSSAHAVVAKASSVVLESFFGKKCSFTDRTHESLYGARTYNTLAEYAAEGAWSRVLGGIHYHPTADDGLIQGKKVGDLVNGLPFKVAAQHD
jgi:hypothetical protein